MKRRNRVLGLSPLLTKSITYDINQTAVEAVDGVENLDQIDQKSDTGAITDDGVEASNPPSNQPPVQPSNPKNGDSKMSSITES